MLIKSPINFLHMEISDIGFLYIISEILPLNTSFVI